MEYLNYEEIKDLIELCQVADSELLTIYENYSGRNMVGRTCTGIVSHLTIQDLLAEIAEIVEEEDTKLIYNQFTYLVRIMRRSDNMGKDYIYY